MLKKRIGSIGECKDLIASFETEEYYVGEEIECVIYTRDKSGLYVPDDVDKTVTTSFWVCVQTHGHVTIGHKLLVDKAIKLPKVYRKLNDISVKNCGTTTDFPETLPHFVNYTGERGYCILYGPPVLEEFKITPQTGNEVCVKYTIKLPKLLPPSFVGKLVRYTYFVTFSVCEDAINNPGKVKNYHIPIQIHFIPQQPPKSLVDKNGFFSIKGIDIIDNIRNHDFEANINLRYQHETPKYHPRNDIEAFGCDALFSQNPEHISNKAQFNVTYDTKKVASIYLVQDVQGPYGMIQINIDFNREFYICNTTVVELQFVEYLLNFYNKEDINKNNNNNNMSAAQNNDNNNNLKTNIYNISTVDKYESTTLYMENIYFDLQIPFYGLTFSTDLMDVQWLLKFSFLLKSRDELVQLNEKNKRDTTVSMHLPNENVKEHKCELQYPLKNYA
jgi:hypothetical protein